MTGALHPPTAADHAPAPDGRPVPGDRGLPLLGHTLEVLSGRYYTSRERYDRYGPVSSMRVFGREVVTVQGPEAVGAVLQNAGHDVASGPGWRFLIGPFFDRGLMLLDFDEHRRHRRIVQQAFTAERLAGYLPTMRDTLAAGIDAWPDTDRFLVYPALKDLTLQVATRTLMGGELGPEADRLNRAFSDCVRAATAIVRHPVPGGRWARGLRGRRMLEAYLRPLVAARREGDGTDLFSALCLARDDDGSALDDTDVVNHMIFLLMAAHDTSTITLTTMIAELARHPEWQQRCREASLALADPEPDLTALETLRDLDLVMRESMRVVTAVPGLARRTVRDTVVGGVRIPAGTQVALNLHATHQLAEIWTDPARFDPERFAEDRREDKRHRFAWVPFGGGVHKCIGLHFGGMEVKAAMHRLLLTHSWEVPAGYRMPVDWTSLPRPRDGLPVRLRRL